jgi:hypothetical protein
LSTAKIIKKPTAVLLMAVVYLSHASLAAHRKETEQLFTCSQEEGEGGGGQLFELEAKKNRS